MIDSHCHLDFEAFDADRDAALDRARDAGVEGFVVAGYDPAGWEGLAALARAHRDVIVACGAHPWAVARAGDEDADAMVAALERVLAAPGEVAPVAVGELGLDRSGRVPDGSTPRQERVFRGALALARERDLPVVLHVVAAHGRALEILEADGAPAAGGMVHGYSGSAELVSRYLDLGLYVSFGTTVTRPGARRAHEAARVVPADRLLVETDAPDRAPPSRPDRNEPAFVADVVRALAGVRGEDAEQIARTTAANARRLFPWPE